MNFGTSHDTSEFAVESISRWWETVGKNTFPEAKKLYINCDCGGSNGSRVKLWKYQLQQLANRTDLEINVSHFPPGTSKWNKIEHRLFCYISKNWAGKPLIDVETVVNLISNTTTKTGLSVVCERDDKVCPLAQKVSDEDYEAINIRKISPFEVELGVEGVELGVELHYFSTLIKRSYFFTVPCVYKSYGLLFTISKKNACYEAVINADILYNSVARLSLI